jgi:hypothetical protein
MKNTIKTILAVSVLVMTLPFIGCKKEKYQLKGDYQTAGNYQPAGNYGNTIIESKIFDDFEELKWVQANLQYEDTLKYPAITQSVLDKGSVIVYMKLSNDSTTWYTLPFTSSPGVVLQPALNLGMVRICCNKSLSSGSIKMKFRVVIFAAANRAANPKVNFNNYLEVKKTFNLID